MRNAVGIVSLDTALQKFGWKAFVFRRAWRDSNCDEMFL